MIRKLFSRIEAIKRVDPSRQFQIKDDPVGAFQRLVLWLLDDLFSRFLPSVPLSPNPLGLCSSAEGGISFLASHNLGPMTSLTLERFQRNFRPRESNGVEMSPAFLSVLFHVLTAYAAEDASQIAIKVNGKAITRGDIEFAATTRQVKSEDRDVAEVQLIERLIDRQLIRDFLRRQKIQPPVDEVQAQIQHAKLVLQKRGEDPEVFLSNIGYTTDRLQSELGLPLSWQIYVRKVVTAPHIRECFDEHRAEFDGTELRACQIFLALRPDASPSDVVSRTNQMHEIRDQIQAGTISFVDAVQKFSESPSKERGGDVGQFHYRGKLPPTVSRAAFAMELHQISDPILSAKGIHLIQLTERIPGDLSLEDARSQILERLSDELWTKIVEQERQTAKIERLK